MATERSRPPALHRSIFARLVTIMLVIAAVLLALVSGFYFAVVIPGIHASLDRVVGPHVRAMANLHPDLAAARRFAESLDMEVRFEGPAGGWTTDESLPTLEEAKRLRHGGWHSYLLVPRRTYYIAAVDDGHYIFSRNVGEDFSRAHNLMLVMLLVLMTGVFVTAYLVMKSALRPLRLLGAGVTQLSEGRLDVVVPKRSHDEFGVLTDAFNHMARRVRDMVEARDQLLRDVSHELRSPLARMKVALEMMPEGSQRDSMASDVAEMETMVTELLELERSRDAGVTRERFDLVAVARQMTERYGDRSPGVRVAQTPKALHLVADERGMRMVLRNLIENAVKFSLPDSAPVEVAIEAHDGEAVVRVRDDGAGIPAGDAERLFEPFVRTDPSRSKKTGGFGLGLSICKRIVEAHGGTIELERGTNRGVTAVVRFPARG